MKTAIKTLEKEINKMKVSEELEGHKKAIKVLKNYIQALEWQSK